MASTCTIRVAAAQLEAFDLAHATDSLQSIDAAIDRAAADQIQLLVLPECAYPAYYLGSAEAYHRSAALNTAAWIDHLAIAARRHTMHIVCGVVEEDRDRIFNSAALIAPDGLVGIGRKTFLWDCDNDWFTPGDRIQAFDTALGRIGMMICADARAPETAAALAADGAELIAMPTCWVNVSRDPGVLYNIQPEFLIESRAREFSVPFVCADKFGPESPLHYVGRSMIADHLGRVRAAAPLQGDMLVTCDIDPHPARRATPTADQAAELLTPRTAELPPDGQTQRELAITADGFTTADARRADLAGRDVMTFVPIRCAALRDVQVVCIDNAPDDIATLRTRAAENRVFLLARNDTQRTIIDPDGAVVARAPATDTSPLSAPCDLNRADIKRFTPQTDLWAQRRVNAYRF